MESHSRAGEALPAFLWDDNGDDSRAESVVVSGMCNLHAARALSCICLSSFVRTAPDTTRPPSVKPTPLLQSIGHGNAHGAGEAGDISGPGCGVPSGNH